MKKNSDQGKKWTFVFYPESAPSDYPDVIRRFLTPYAFSPVHDPDPDNKKPHVHLYLEFEHNMRQHRIIQDFMTPLGVGNLYPQYVFNAAQCVKYLSHLEEKWDKIRYDPMDVTWSGIDYIKYLTSESGTSTVLEEIVDFLNSSEENYTYRGLYSYAVSNDLLFWQDYIEHNTYKINSLLR